MHPTTSCLIPFYNEEKTIKRTLDIISTAKNIERTICVDDGSTDRSAEIVQKTHPQVELISVSSNQGKTEALRHGLKKVVTPYVLLLDADLHNLRADEIDNALMKIQKQPDIDMIVFRRIREPFIVRLFRMDTVLSGQRILRTNDLKQILTEQISGYEIEVAMNAYMMNQQKKVYWMPISAVNSKRVDKWGLKKSIETNLKMFGGFIRYPGLVALIYQLVTFCREEAV